MTDKLSQWIALAESLQGRCVRLAPVIRQVGPPTVKFERDAYRALAESILSQQLAPRAAATIIERFRALSPPFPRPDVVVRLPPARMREAGVSARKGEYLKALAKAWGDPAWRRGWDRLSDGALVERLVQVKGVGEWTAHMFLIFSLGRPDVLPVGDYGVRRGIQLLFRLPELPSPKAVAALVPHWAGAASVASWYLWRALDRKLLGAILK